MNRIVSLVFFVILFTTNTFSQKSLSDYSYVVVSEQFEFQKEKDKYELNSLTKFLFNKHGFHAFFDREVPSNVNRCNGLWAEAEGTPGFIITKVQLILRDCNGIEVYRTKFGKSKVKDYKKAYYECMREAFTEIESIGVQQKEIGATEYLVVPAETVVAEKSEVIIDNTSSENTVIINNTLNNLPSSKYTNYSSKGKSFLLRKTSNGYNLYQEFENLDNDLQLVGKIKVTSTNLEFIDTNNIVSSVHFDALENLIIEKENKAVIYILEN